MNEVLTSLDALDIGEELLIPSTFEECLTYAEQLMFLLVTKQNTLTAGSNITLTPNADGTVTISSTGGSVESHTYAIAKYNGDDRTIYRLIDVETEEPSGEDIVVPEAIDGVGIADITGVVGVEGTTVVVTLTDDTTQTFMVQRGPRGVQGETGPAGSDGFSPLATVTQTASGATIEITDANGTTTANIDNGVDGQAGSDGFSPLASVTQTSSGATITITDANGTTTANIDNGSDGAQGPAGTTPNVSATATVAQSTGVPSCVVTKSGTEAAPQFTFAFSGIKGEQGLPGTGQDGVGISNIAYKEEVTEGYVYTITLSNNQTYDFVAPFGPQGPAGATGGTGATGPAGSDGFSPLATVTQTASGATITITDVNGTTTANIDNGVDGQAGSDGFSPLATVTQTASGATIEITDANGTTTANINNGADGQAGTTPVISATASVDNTYGIPSVSVTKSGTDAAPSFAFAFRNLKGLKGNAAQVFTVERASEAMFGQLNTNIAPFNIGRGYEKYGIIPFGDFKFGAYPYVNGVIHNSAYTNWIVDSTPTVIEGISYKGRVVVNSSYESKIIFDLDHTADIRVLGSNGGNNLYITDTNNNQIATSTIKTSKTDPDSGASYVEWNFTNIPAGSYYIVSLPGNNYIYGVITTGSTVKDRTRIILTSTQYDLSSNPTGNFPNGVHDVYIGYAYDGAQGTQGPAGQGVPSGGTAGQVLAKASGTDYDTEWVTPSSGGGGPAFARFGLLGTVTPSATQESGNSIAPHQGDSDIIHNYDCVLLASFGSYTRLPINKTYYCIDKINAKQRTDETTNPNVCLVMGNLDLSGKTFKVTLNGYIEGQPYNSPFNTEPGVYNGCAIPTGADTIDWADLPNNTVLCKFNGYATTKPISSSSFTNADLYPIQEAYAYKVDSTHIEIVIKLFANITSAPTSLGASEIYLY